MAITIKRIQIQSCINDIEFTDIYIYIIGTVACSVL